MKKKKPSLTPFWICLVLGTLTLIGGIAGLIEKAAFGDIVPSLIIGAALLVGAFLLKRKYERDLAARRRAAARRQAEEKAARQKRQDEIEAQRQRAVAAREAQKQREAEWSRTHGQIVTKIAGVTFDNDDGSSRQRILKAAMAEEACGSIALELYDHRGADAIAVLYDDQEIGNIPKSRVAEVKAVMDRITAAHLDVGRFRPEDDEDEGEPRGVGEYIYRADLTLVYTKDAP